MPDESFRIVPVDATNAHRVGEVFRSIYGDDFPVKDVYNPEVLCREIQAGRLASALAFSKEEQAAGYVSMFKTAPNPRIWEAGNVTVVPTFTRTDVASRLVRYCLDLIARNTADCDGFFEESICSHYFTQVKAAKIGMVDCALELDQLDGKSLKDNKSNKANAARISCILSFQEMTDPHEPEYIPIRYNEILQQIARSLRPRTLITSTAVLPAYAITKLEEKYYASAGTWKVAVPTVGSDWAAAVDDILNKARQRQVISLQIAINMACPQIGAAVEILRKQGFFFGGIAPRWFGTDGLLMQKLFGSKTEYEKIKLYTQTAKGLLSFIKSDRESV